MESGLVEEGREAVDGAMGEGLRKGVSMRSQSRYIGSDGGRGLEGLVVSSFKVSGEHQLWFWSWLMTQGQV